MAPQAHLVLIETAGNQAYIFGTNRLREQVGASELIRRIGTTYVLDAVAEVSGRPRLAADRPDQLAENLLNREKNPPFGTAGGPGVEVVVATSGKALLLVESRARGEAIVARVTERALREAPGAVVRGFVSEPFVFQDAGCLHKVVKDVHQGIEGLRLDLPAPQARFPTLPVLEPCSSSGLPASHVEHSGVLAGQYAIPVPAKWQAREDAIARFKPLEKVNECLLALHLGELEELGSEWLGYIHADGNGLGAIFLDFQGWRTKAGRNPSARAYLNDYRHFSLAIDSCTNAAFWTAAKAVTAKPDPEKQQVPRVVPLILGGDDLTVICDGRKALSFAAAYLLAFENRTREADDDGGAVLRAIAAAATGSPGLAACAGVSVVKPHFPAHRAYELAEALIGSAKSGVKRKVGEANEQVEIVAGTKLHIRPACSALDFHVHFDSSGADLEAIRALSVIDRRDDTNPKSRTEPTAKPYVVTDRNLLAGLSGGSNKWLGNRYFTDLQAIAADLTKPKGKDERDAALPRNQQHYLREGVFLGKAAADARMNQIRHRYPDFGWKRLLHPLKAKDRERNGLFFMEIEKTAIDEDVEVTRTRLLDALELAELEGGAGNDN